MITLKQFTYTLPPALIANQPAEPRDHSRLLVFDRTRGTWSHHYFYDLPQILRALPHPVTFVRNNSRVIPARLYARKPTGAHVEVLLTRCLRSTDTEQVWSCITKPGLKPSQVLLFPPSSFHATCISISNHYSREISFPYNQKDFMQFVREYGHTPIPPYIHTNIEEPRLRTIYQTVYARPAGSVAAPTAGLHFTEELTRQLQAAGHEFIDVTLHVGLGTFLGVKTNDLRQHHMHTEQYFVEPPAIHALIDAVANNRPLLAVGTTSTRVLESIYAHIFGDNPHSQPLPRSDLDLTQPLAGETNIFIYPPYRFQLTNHLITNFHLPESTLLMLVSAFTSFPQSKSHFTSWEKSPLGQAYQDAIAQQYRFFSFGDAMLIL